MRPPRPRSDPKPDTHKAFYDVARKIVREFTAAHLNSRAITALGYLSEAITANNAPATLVTEVREYIVSLRTSPERDIPIRS